MKVSWRSPEQKIRAKKTALKVKDVADLIGVHVDTIYDWAKAKRNPIPHFRIGATLRFDPALIAPWFESKQVNAK